jgi:hypothetical protein
MPRTILYRLNVNFLHKLETFAQSHSNEQVILEVFDRMERKAEYEKKKKEYAELNGRYKEMKRTLEQMNADFDMLTSERLCCYYDLKNIKR